MGSRHQEVVETCIDVADLALGMHVVRLDKPWEDTNFLLQGFVIRDRSEIDALRTQCEFVFIEGRVERKAALRQPAAPRPKSTVARLAGFFSRGQPPRQSAGTRPKQAGAPRKRVTYINKVSTGQEMETAVARFEEAQQTAKSIMSGLRIGRALDMNNARSVVNHCVDSVLRNESALLLLTKIKNQDEYTAEHCLNVSILCAAFGKHLGLLEGEIRLLALCGLLHDVGKTRTPVEVLNKPGALTPREFDIMRRHTTHGRSILMSTSHSLNAAVDVAFSHHERIDGQGYPRGLQAKQIPYFAKLVSLVDTYDAITSTRVYDKGRASMQALETIHKHRGSQFDETLADAFIQMIGLYPPGSIVEMLNGEVGIVVESHPKYKLKPKVLMVLEADKVPMTPYMSLNLMSAPSDNAGTAYQIAREVPDGTYGIVLQDFVDQGLIVSSPSTDEDPSD